MRPGIWMPAPVGVSSPSIPSEPTASVKMKKSEFALALVGSSTRRASQSGFICPSYGLPPSGLSGDGVARKSGL